MRPRLAIGLFLILILVAAGGLVLKLWKGKSADPALVAVLPFEDLNGDPAERYFSRGVTEEVITQLGRVASTAFGVIGSSSVRSYSTSQPAPRQVAADLGALYMITGTVQHAGSSVRIAVRLTRTRDGVQIWTDAFDGPSDAILAVQQDVAVSVAHAVQAQVSVPLSKAVDRPKLSEVKLKVTPPAASGRRSTTFSEHWTGRQTMRPRMRRSPIAMPLWCTATILRLRRVFPQGWPRSVEPSSSILMRPKCSHRKVT